jgi:hypothetical protein
MQLTYPRAITGEHRAKALAMRLITLSQSFAVEPYPDDQWKFNVKPEAGFLLDREAKSAERSIDR